MYWQDKWQDCDTDYREMFLKYKKMICSILKDQKNWSNKYNVVMFKATHRAIIHHHITLLT